MERVDQNDAIFTYCQGDISVGIIDTMLYATAALQGLVMKILRAGGK